MQGVRQHGPARTFYEQCLDAAEALSARGYRLNEGRILAVYPYGHRNPFLRMLYATAFDHGFAVLPLESLSQLEEAPLGLEIIVHHHWIHRIFDDLTSEAAADAAVERFFSLMKKQKDIGRPLVWTVHNVLSHRSAFPAHETALRADFAKLVDHIHIMNPQSAHLCSDHYTLPEEKLFQVPHPAYVGVYGNYTSRAQARLSLGVQPDDAVFVLFGELGPYKGTRQFLGQLDALQERLNGTAKVIIAGKESSGPYMENIFSLTSGRTDVQLCLGHIDDQNVQTFFRAADVAVCAHTAGLNSGVAATALTFACPTVIASRMAGTVAGAQELLFEFDAERPESIVNACCEAYSARGKGTEERASVWASENSPHNISSRFFSGLRARL